MGAECSTETSATAAEDFEAAEAFAGARAGWAFRAGDRGTGYYRDGRSEPSPTGVRVIRVDSEGCAAGRLRVDDVVIRINGVHVSGHRDAMSALESSLNPTGNVAITIQRRNIGEMIVTIHKASVSVPIGLEFQGYNTFYTCDTPPVATSAAAVRPVEKPVETPVAKSEGHAAVGALEIVQCILCPFAFCAL